MSEKRGAFTIVELLIVVVVLSIIATFVFLTFRAVQADVRNDIRNTRASIIADSLEKYYESNGEYPSCAHLTASASVVTSETLTTMDPGVLRTPLAPDSTDNSIECGDDNLDSSDIFAFIGDGSGSCETGESCLKWDLKYREERSNNIITIASKRRTDIETSGPIAINRDSVGFDRISLSWNSVPNAVNYTLQISANSSFSSPTQVTIGSLSYVHTGLAQDTTRYYRVKANSSTGDSTWSNTVSGTTKKLNIPSISVSNNSATQQTVNWAGTANPDAAGYVVECSSDNTNWSVCRSDITTTSTSFTGLAQGMPRYYRVKAVNGSFSSDWGTGSGVTPINAPAAFTVAGWNDRSTWNILYAHANNAVCPAGTTRSVDWHRHSNLAGNGFWVGGAAHSTVAYTMSWGERLTLQAFARCTTAHASSAFTEGTNRPYYELIWPAGSFNIGGASGTRYWRGFGIYGFCPNYTDSFYFNWKIQNSYFTASGSSPVYSRATHAPHVIHYEWWRTNSEWGNGGALGRISCVGPWGTASSDFRNPYGGSCWTGSPPIQCYWPAGW